MTSRDATARSGARLKALHETVERLKQEHESQRKILVMQGSLLSDAADLFEELGYREMWERHIALYCQPQVETCVRIWQAARQEYHGPVASFVAAGPGDHHHPICDPHVELEAQSRRDHGTITAQSSR